MEDLARVPVPIKNIQTIMDVNTYLKSLLNDIQSYQLTPEEEKMISLGQLELYLTNKIFSKKFRKNNLTEKTRETIKNKIKLSMKDNKPLFFIFAFGGYKNSWVKEYAPYIEWAEVFNIIYISQLLYPLAKVYKPGVYFLYESECEAVMNHDNYTRLDVDSYTSSFKELIKFMKPYLPDNIKFDYTTLPEQYDTEALFKTVRELLSHEIEKLKKLPKEELDKMIKRSLFNLKRNGQKNYANASEEDLYKVALESLAFDHVFLEEDYKIREGFFNADERITTIGTYCSPDENPDNWITLNSCTRSANAYWTSRGVVFDNNGEFEHNILGPETYAKIEPKVKFVETDMFAGITPKLNTIPVVSN